MQKSQLDLERVMKFTFTLFLMIFSPCFALAQSSPGFSYGQVPTAGQWNSAFASKQDVLRFVPLNQAGGAMSGPLRTAPSTINSAGFSLSQGIAPSNPVNGDIWATSTAIFARVGGATLQLGSVGSIPSGSVLGNVSGAAAPPAGTTLSALLDSVIGSARGTLAVRNSSGWSGLSLGASGTVLQSNGADAVFAAPAAGSGAIRYDAAQGITPAQQLQARQNAGTRGSGILVKSAAYTIAATDAGKLIAANGTFALTLPLAASVGNGFAVEMSNTGTGKITLVPNGSDTIRGATSLVVNQQESGAFISDGTNWQAIGLTPVLISSGSVSGSFYRRYSDGFTQQWGDVTGGTDAKVITFPLAFTSSVNVTASFTSFNGSTTTLTAIPLGSRSLSGFTAYPRFSNASGGGGGVGVATDNWSWQAEGY